MDLINRETGQPAHWAHDPHYSLYPDETARQPTSCTILNRCTRQVAGQAAPMAVIRVPGRPCPIHVAARHLIDDAKGATECTS
jgi:hypothetical protein